MSTAALAVPVGAATATTTNHFYCCDKDRALCGVDLTGHDEVSTVDCVVCIDLDDTDTPCGPGCPMAVAS